MGKARLWCMRTVLNWRWWMILPIIPLALIGIALSNAGEGIEHLFKKAHQWQKRGWLA